MNNLTNIGQEEQQPGKPLSEAQLLAWVEGRLQGEELHEVEQWIATEGMESDALEGLQALPATEVKELTGKINHKLLQALSAKKKRKRRPMSANKVSWIAIGIILLLAVACYVLFCVMTNGHLKVK